MNSIQKFSDYKEQLHQLFSGAKSQVKYDKKYLIKGDLSGIQDFIFNISSEGASKSLKARSFFVQAVADVTIQLLKERLGEIEEFYNGGGNFYLFTNHLEEEKIQQVLTIVNNELKEEGLYVAISYTEVRLDDFGYTWDSINRISAERKLQKYAGIDYDKLFTPFEQQKSNNYKSLADDLVKTGKVKINLFGIDYELNIQRKNGYGSNIPVWKKRLLVEKEELIQSLGFDSFKSTKPAEGNIIEFSMLAAFAKERTGTSKIGVLKMDVDNLGLLFKKLKGIDQIRTASQALAFFFGEYLDVLLGLSFQYVVVNDGNKITRSEKFADNIYVIFSGGDDCFFIGAWDAVFEFSLRIRDEFKKFTEDIGDLTLSASILLLSPHFPVIRFAEMAEDDLHKAKHAENDKKDKVSVFGEIISWPEFAKVVNIKDHLLELITERGEHKALLERIKNSSRGFEKLQNRALAGNLSAPKIWRLDYYLRNVKDQNLDFIEKHITDQYKIKLIEAFQGKKSNPMIFPIAARWTELLTRNK